MLSAINRVFFCEFAKLLVPESVSESESEPSFDSSKAVEAILEADYSLTKKGVRVCKWKSIKDCLRYPKA